MPPLDPRIPAQFMVPLNMNGLRGRMLRMPAPKGKKRDILLLYNIHSTIERFYGLAEALNDFGSVTVPDLPGFGGMNSFYNIGERPDIDTLADYLASFVKLRYNHRKHFTIVGVAMGFVVATRMLQRYPEIASRVDVAVSIVGFTRYDEYTFSRLRYNAYYYSTRFFTLRLPAFLYRNLVLHPSMIRLAYARTHNARHKFKGLNKDETRAAIDYEVYLWRVNDVRTYMYTTAKLLKVDNCRALVDVPVWHVALPDDSYFDHHAVEQHLHVIYKRVRVLRAKITDQVPTVLSDKSDALNLMPRALTNMLDKYK